MFKKPMFPPKPSLVTKWVDPEGTTHIRCDRADYPKHPDCEAWEQAVAAVFLPWWYRLWRWFTLRDARPSLVPSLQEAFDAAPRVIKGATVIHLRGEYQAVPITNKVEGTLIIDGGEEK